MNSCIIFYSWQSDLPNATNRSFIEKALNIAVKSIRNDDSIQIEPVIDRDTSGVPGSPDIDKTILDKIEQSQIFVCDVSIINSSKKSTKTPNPNVLVELGYALRALGSGHIIMVMNLAFGKPEILPFDLKMKRVIQYDMPQKTEDRSSERKKLATVLENAIRTILDSAPSSAIKRGRWAKNGKALAKKGHEALDVGDFETAKEVFIHLASLSTSTRHELYLRGQTSIQDATPFPLTMKLLRTVIDTDFGLFMSILSQCRIYALIDDKPFTSLSLYEQIPDKSISVITGVLSACCIYDKPTKEYWAEQLIVKTLCQILVGLGFIFTIREIELPEPTSQLWYTASCERTVPDGQPKEILPFIELIHRMAFLPQPLFDYALINLKYDQDLSERLLKVDSKDGLEKNDAIVLAKSWAVVPGYGLIAGNFAVKDKSTLDECAKIIYKNNEIGLHAVTKIRENMIAERECLYKQNNKKKI